MEQIKKYWSQALPIIQKEVDPMSMLGFKTFIEPVKPYSIDGNKLVLIAPTSFIRDVIMNKYFPLIKNAICAVSGNDYDITIICEGENAKAVKNVYDPYNNFNPRYVFSSFVVGNSNRMAHAASLAVAESPGSSYNPLYLYGNVGLGKTHLMHSIAHYILDKNPSAKVVYASCEKFTNELINAIRDDKNQEFRDKYRNVDVLLIDDIQFIAQKERTQEEFFHTFNALYECNKQIIISSDRPPREITPLEERLRSRFECGLLADIQPPDYETRIAILRKKADTEGIYVPDDVMEYIANMIVSNIRELEGALTRVIAFASLINNREITLSIAEEALKDVFNHKQVIVITPDRILDIVGNYYNVKVEELKGRKRPKNIAFPRMVSMYLTRKLTDLSLPKIGEQFGGKDHTTVINACKRIEEELDKNPEFEKTLAELEKRIKGN